VKDPLLEHEWDLRSVDFPLTRTSAVWEVGGYEGRWAQAIQDRYQPALYVFEPQAWAFAKLQDRFRGASNVRIFPFGLGERYAELPMSEFETDGASFNRPPSRAAGLGKLHEIAHVASLLHVAEIDLMLVNIEGYEFVLIPHMVHVGLLPRRLLVQMHPFGEFSEAGLRAVLGQCYRLVWDYGHILTAWERMEPAAAGDAHA